MLYSKWNTLSLVTRVQIATAFGVAKIGPTHVFNNTIQSDGYYFHDIERNITVEKLQTYLNSKEKDFDVLWEQLVAKTEGKELTSSVPPVLDAEDTGKVEIIAPKETSMPKRRGRPSKTTGK